MKRPYVLIAEDDPTLQALWRIATNRWRWLGAVNVVGDGGQAMTEITREVPDVLITDLDMPVMSGESLIQTLAGIEAYSRLPVVVVSSGDVNAVAAYPNVVAAFNKSTPLKKVEDVLRQRLDLVDG